MATTQLFSSLILSFFPLFLLLPLTSAVILETTLVHVRQHGSELAEALESTHHMSTRTHEKDEGGEKWRKKKVEC